MVVTVEAKGARSEDGSEAPARAGGGQDGGRGEDGRHDSSNRAVLGAERRQDGDGEDGCHDDSSRARPGEEGRHHGGGGEDGRHDGDGDGRGGGDSIEQSQRSTRAPKGRGKLSLHRDDGENETDTHSDFRPGGPGAQQGDDRSDPTAVRKVAAHAALQAAAHVALPTAAQDDGAASGTSTDDDRLVIDERITSKKSGDSATSTDETDGQVGGGSECNRARDELKRASRQTDSDAATSKVKRSSRTRKNNRVSNCLTQRNGRVAKILRITTMMKCVSKTL
ncbi:hypothetical protein HPB48_011142 [Haemaphysalis longicornis]|uniref:Uncharacterized protein n=1 Tax=Haemaphysalis longicornis TaxID=44386 RepID=A0A9J6GIX2_HAELO|nr:hypothetical protein HPB48_011142 [Haemaphysalis longicornis]